jgi:hypothetical protein
MCIGSNAHSSKNFANQTSNCITVSGSGKNSFATSKQLNAEIRTTFWNVAIALE